MCTVRQNVDIFYLNEIKKIAEQFIQNLIAYCSSKWLSKPSAPKQQCRSIEEVALKEGYTFFDAQAARMFRLFRHFRLITYLLQLF